MLNGDNVSTYQFLRIAWYVVTCFSGWDGWAQFCQTVPDVCRNASQDWSGGSFKDPRISKWILVFVFPHHSPKEMIEFSICRANVIFKYIHYFTGVWFTIRRNVIQSWVGNLNHGLGTTALDRPMPGAMRNPPALDLALEALKRMGYAQGL